jgi:CheY-like chemotaxis protein/two-component sensor histidine kinase
LERQLNHLQRLESLGRLASGVSHDMNNVLGTIMAIGSLLQAKYGQDPAIVKDAELLQHAAVRGRDLVQGLRDFSRKELQSARRLDLNDILRHEADLLERTSLKRFSIVLDLAPNLPLVFGEASGIQNALMNLCVNAMDAMPDKGTLTLSSRDLGQGFVELTVADDGQGMSPEVLARALEPFFTTKPIGKGTGLGLSQVYGTVKAHGGSLDIKSKPGEGTKVAMVFPSVQVQVDGTSPEHHALGHPGHVLKVLLVDDEEMIRGTVLSLLDVLGHHAQAASSGIEALRRLDAGMEVDLVILDINMPGIDGIETLVRLRIAHPEIKVLLATGYADDRIPSVLRRFPDIRILKKPFMISELNRVLSDCA